VTFPSAGAVYRQRRAWLIGITSAAEDRDVRFFFSALRSCRIRALAGTAAMISPQTPASSKASPIDTLPLSQGSGSGRR
jgi:hypothetical protein